MKNIKTASHGLALTLVTWAAVMVPQAHAGDAYGAIGFPGITLGYAHPVTDAVKLRGEYSGGLTINRSGVREGADYEGKFKAQSIGGFADYYPFSNGFRLTGGITFNDTKFNLSAKGGTNSNATINGKTVNLNGETLNVDVTYPAVTPYLGIGWGSNPTRGKGWGFHTDLGFTIGKFDAKTNTTIVGKNSAGQGLVTQADVDAQNNKLRDSLGKLPVLPKLTVGVSYTF